MVLVRRKCPNGISVRLIKDNVGTLLVRSWLVPKQERKPAINDSGWYLVVKRNGGAK